MFHFYFQSPNWVDILTLVITISGLFLAVYALNQWRKEKKWDILLEAKCNAKLALEFLEYSYSWDQIDLDYKNPKYKNDAELVTIYGSEPILFERKIHLNEHPFTEERIRTINEKLKAILEKDKNVLFEYYNTVVTRINEIDYNMKMLKIHNILFDSGSVDPKDYETHAENYRSIVRKSTQVPDLEKLTQQLEEINNYNINK